MEGTPQGSGEGVPTTIKDISRPKEWATLIHPGTYGKWGRGMMTPQLSQDCPSTTRFFLEDDLPRVRLEGRHPEPIDSDQPQSVELSRSPWNSNRLCGGSSGGAAIAPVTGMERYTLFPSHTYQPMRDIGRKPTFGRVSCSSGRASLPCGAENHE